MQYIYIYMCVCVNICIGQNLLNKINDPGVFAEAADHTC